MDVSSSVKDSGPTVDVRARRRKLHTEAEQRRRDAIKRGFDGLLELIPSTKTGAANSHLRMSKATILNRSISMILKASKIQTQKRLEIETLRKKVQALQILKGSYERMSNASSYTTETHDAVITDHFNLRLFQLFMESLFQSFDAAVSAFALPDLSDQITAWLETSCKPELLHQTMEHLLNSVLYDGHNAPNQQHHSRSLVSHQPQNPVYEVHTNTECLGQSISTPQRISNTYRRSSLKLSNSLEAAQEPQFLMSDALPPDQRMMDLPGGYQPLNCHHVSNTFDRQPVYTNPSQQTYVRAHHQSVFPIRQYRSSEDPGLSNKFSNPTPTASATQRHSPSPPSISTSSVFHRSSTGIGNGSTGSRSLVVNSTLPASCFESVQPFATPETIFAASQNQYRSGNGSNMQLSRGPYTKQSPF